MARLTVLGIAQDGGHPQTGCSRPCCAPAHADRRRGHHIACLGLADGDRRWLLDCTPDIGAQLAALGGSPLDGILLTHAHMGHYTGLLQLGPEAWAPTRVPVYAMPGMASFLRANQPWGSLLDDGHVDLRPLAADVGVRLSDQLTVTPWLVPHRGPWTETVAFHVQGPRRSAMYLPDLDRWDDWDRDLADILAQVDAAYVDGSFFDRGELGRRDTGEILHPLVVDTMDRFQHLPDALRARLVFLHLNHTNPLLDPASEAFAAVHQRGYRVAREGEVLEL
jgi:pyrroloquinoline quinone biosynthesis protein B